jgi:hypothetical protein
VFQLWPDHIPWHRMPDMGESPDGAVKIGVLAMSSTVFLTLVGQGCPAREALTLTLALGMGSAEVTRHLSGRRSDGPGGQRR